MARNFEFIKDITDRKDLCKISVKVKDKWNVLKERKEHFEMVVVDSKVSDEGLHFIWVNHVVFLFVYFD
jgi:hypothetical protein